MVQASKAVDAFKIAIGAHDLFLSFHSCALGKAFVFGRFICLNVLPANPSWVALVGNSFKDGMANASLQNMKLESKVPLPIPPTQNVGESELQYVDGDFLPKYLMKALLMMRKSLLNPFAETLVKM